MVSRILVVDDHPLFAEALRQVLADEFPRASIAGASTVSEAKEHLSGGAGFDLALLDLWLPDTCGLEGLISLRLMAPRLPVVVVSAFEGRAVVERTMICGAAGFIPKSATREDVLRALRRVLRGDLAVPPGMEPSEVVAPAPDTPCAPSGGQVAAPPQPVAGRDMWSYNILTGRQLNVLQMLCSGMLNKQIAHHLDVGETTVKAHIGEILRKLGVATRTQAVVEVSQLNFAVQMYARSGLDLPVLPPGIKLSALPMRSAGRA